MKKRYVVKIEVVTIKTKCFTACSTNPPLFSGREVTEHRSMLVQNTASKINGFGKGTGSGHAGHLTGRGGRLWRERWWNGSDAGRLQGAGEVGNNGTRGLVTDR